METVGLSNFIKIQIKKNGITKLSNISLKEIASYAEEELNKNNYKKGYRDGVLIIQTNDSDFCKHFKCPLVKIDENTKLISKVNKRMTNEESYIQTIALNGKHLKTRKVELILYRKDVLDETKEASSNTDWELIAFHAIPEGVEKMPIKPVTMMRNQLALQGGTKAYYSSEEWAESINFWQKYASIKN